MLLEQFANIGKRIKELREQKKLSIAELAALAGVDEPTLSNVENFRTLPDLHFIAQLATGLHTPVAGLFAGITTGNDTGKPYLLLRASDRQKIDREDSTGIDYEVIMTRYINNSLFTPTIVTVRSGIYRAPVATNAMEFVFIISGSIITSLNDDIIELNEGDTLFYDARIPHSISNTSNKDCVLLSVYLMSAE